MMKTRKQHYRSIALLVLVLGVSTTLTGQQEAMYTHYSYNTLAVNPAYAGSRDALTFTALHRSQWVSFPGAPVTQTLTIHSPVLNEKLGLGLSIVNDKAGPLKHTMVNVDATYILYLNREDRLAFGIKGGLDFFKGDFADIVTGEEGDNVFGIDIGTKAKPNFGLGVYYYKPNFYAGISSPGLLKNSYSNSNESNGLETYTQDMHFYFISGAVFDINFDWKFKPTTFVKLTKGAPIEADITPTFILRDKVNLGVMYRTGDGFGILAGMHLNEQLLLGYSFDWSLTNPTGKYNDGSHEIMLRYDFIYKHRMKIKSPRYF